MNVLIVMFHSLVSYRVSKAVYNVTSQRGCLRLLLFPYCFIV